MNWRLDQMKLIYLYIKYTTDTESYKALGKKEKEKKKKQEKKFCCFSLT